MKPDSTCAVFGRLACTALLLSAFATPAPCDAAAGHWKPEQNVEIVIPTSPGTGSDATGRWIQQLFRERKLLDVSTTVVNKPGGNTVPAVTEVMAAKPDGTTLLVDNIASLEPTFGGIKLEDIRAPECVCV